MVAAGGFGLNQLIPLRRLPARLHHGHHHAGRHTGKALGKLVRRCAHGRVSITRE